MKLPAIPHPKDLILFGYGEGCMAGAFVESIKFCENSSTVTIKVVMRLGEPDSVAQHLRENGWTVEKDED